jgi:hypothetical protein
MGYGLKRVSHRREDALARVGWQHLEQLLAEHYRRAGYEVEHTGTGHSRSRFDGGIDLKLRRAGEYTVVQVKHWNACKVPHNEIHQLLGIMINEGATGAIFITSGEFTKAAIEAASRHGHVTLIDGDELRQMLGPLPDSELSRYDPPSGFLDAASERLLAAAEDRIRHGRRRPARTAKVGLGLLLVKAVLPLVLLVVGLLFIRSTFDKLGKDLAKTVAPVARHSEPEKNALPAPTTAAATSAPIVGTDLQVNPCREIIDARTGSYIDHCRSQAQTDAYSGAYSPMTPAQLAEERRQADEAARILSRSTPQMADPLPGSHTETTWPKSPDAAAR